MQVTPTARKGVKNRVLLWVGGGLQKEEVVQFWIQPAKEKQVQVFVAGYGKNLSW